MAELYYYENGKWISLPDWARFLIKLGYELATAEEQNNRLIVGLAVPSRGYAACLAAAGAVIRRAQMPVNKFIEEEEHFENICRLAPGTPLAYIKGTRRLKAIFSGIDSFEGEPRIRVQIANKDGGNLTELLNKKMSLAVSVVNDDETRLPKKQLGYMIVARKAFIENLLPGVDINTFALSSSLDCVITGPAALIQREATDTRIAVKQPTGNFVEGTFQDLLRVQRFLFEGKAYRSEVYSVNSSRQPINKCNNPAVAIFDGALSFLKCRHIWTGSNWIALFDRTDPNLCEAAEVINHDYYKKIKSKNPALDLPHVPTGIETIIYEVAQR